MCVVVVGKMWKVCLPRECPMKQNQILKMITEQVESCRLLRRKALGSLYVSIPNEMLLAGVMEVSLYSPCLRLYFRKCYGLVNVLQHSTGQTPSHWWLWYVHHIPTSQSTGDCNHSLENAGDYCSWKAVSHTICTSAWWSHGGDEITVRHWVSVFPDDSHILCTCRPLLCLSLIFLLRHNSLLRRTRKLVLFIHIWTDHSVLF